MVSVITEGSVLTRANLVSPGERRRDAWRASRTSDRGQLNFQGMPCVAALPDGAMVWTSYPSAGSRLTLGLLFGIIEVDEELFKADAHDGPNWWTGTPCSRGWSSRAARPSPHTRRQESRTCSSVSAPTPGSPRTSSTRRAGRSRPAATTIPHAGSSGGSATVTSRLFSARETDWTPQRAVEGR